MTAGASAEREFDVIVVGAGPAGEVAAGRLAGRGGKRVAVVEGHLIGGECSFYACMPSKALLRPAEALHETRRIPGAAEAVTGQLDVPAVLRRRDEVIRHLDDSARLPWLEERGIELVRGWGRLDGDRRICVDDETLIARDAVVLSVGTAAAFPPIPGLREVGAWSNRELTTSEEVPNRLLVLGGDIVGAEMAQAWAWLGASVTVVEALDRLISNEDPFVSEPQVAGVGLTLTAAREQGIEAVAIDLDTSASAGGSFYGRGSDGTSRFVVDTEREILIGVTIVGAEIQDFLQAATIAVVGE